MWEKVLGFIAEPGDRVDEFSEGNGSLQGAAQFQRLAPLLSIG